MAKITPGNIYGYLKIVEKEFRRSGHTYWRCECVCGGTIVLRGDSLLTGNTKSCGCYRRRFRSPDLTGERFGRLTALEKTHKRTRGGACIWLCRCDCGSLKEISGFSLRQGATKSCGCLYKDTRHTTNYKHGLSNTTAYKRTKGRERREMKLSLDSEWTPLMELCLRDYQPVCVVCGSTDRLSTDHVLPLSKGNGLYPGNAVTLCSRHNSIKHAKYLHQLPAEMAAKIREAAESFRVAWSGGF